MRVLIHGWRSLGFPLTTLRLLGFGRSDVARATIHRRLTGYKLSKIQTDWFLQIDVPILGGIFGGHVR